MKRYLFFILFFLVAAVLQAAPVKVATLHPLVSDIVTKVGGDRVKVINMFPEDMDPHRFTPGSDELSSAVGAKLVFLCGKGLEARYMDVLKDSFTGRNVLVDLGADIPDVTITPDSDVIDPHWWNNPENMKIAATKVAKELTRIDPAGKKAYAKGLEAYNKTMDKIMANTRRSMELLPEDRRILVTSHPGMAHFCKAFGMTPYPIPTSADADVDAIAAELKAKGVRCMFHDVSDPTEIFDRVAAKVGCPKKPLIMDGVYSSMRSYGTLFSINRSYIYDNLMDEETEAKARQKRREEILQRYQQGGSESKN